MKKFIHSITLILPITLFIMVMASSCNKELPAAEPIPSPVSTGSSIGELLSADANFSILKAAVIKAGLLDAVSNKANVFTVFAPNDAAFIASGIPIQAIAALPASTIASIVQYHIIPGQKIASTSIPTTFPNVQMPTSFHFRFEL